MLSSLISYYITLRNYIVLTACQYLKGRYKDDGDPLFARSHMEKNKRQWEQVTPGETPVPHKRETFHNENNQPLE